MADEVLARLVEEKRILVTCETYPQWFYPVLDDDWEAVGPYAIVITKHNGLLGQRVKQALKNTGLFDNGRVTVLMGARNIAYLAPVENPADAEPDSSTATLAPENR